MYRDRTLVVVLVVLIAGSGVAVGSVAGQSSIGTQSVAAESHESLDCGFPLEVEDAGGETVTLDEEPTEVVVLYPNVAQHLWEIGAEEKVVGMPVNDNTAYLEGSDQRTDILQLEQGLSVPDTEQIVDLEPDIVLAPNVTPDDAVTQLRDAGETVYSYQLADGFDDVMTMVERTGQLVGDCEAARNVTGEMQETIDFVEEAVPDEDRPRVFYDLGDEPVGPVTVNSGAFEHEVLTTAGAENVAAGVESEFGTGYPQVSGEFIVGEDPEIVVTPGEETSSFPGYNGTTALQNDDVIVVNRNFISQHAPRTVDVLEGLAEELHPEAIEQARQAQDGAMNESNDSDDDVIVDNGSNTDNESADGDGAGLTILAPALALVALALLARRRQS